MQSSSATASAETIIEAVGLSQDLSSFIGGDQVRGTGETQTVLDPSTGERIATFPAAGEGVVATAVMAAAQAGADWGKNDGPRRAATLFNLAGLIRRDAQTIAELESLDSGKPLSSGQERC